jgi:hypothetical protein
MSTKVRQRHGIGDARKVGSIASNFQYVHVTDGDGGEVILSMGTAEFQAGLTPDQACFIAQQLIAAAARAAEKVKGK